MMADTVSLMLAKDAQIATLSARVARLEEALRETLEIARRNEDGAYVERALAALQEQGERAMSANVVDIRKPSDPILRCIGAGRDCENERVLIFSFDRPPTDDEMCFLLDVMRRAAVMSRSGAEE